jgi:hypothetical protein
MGKQGAAASSVASTMQARAVQARMPRPWRRDIAASLIDLDNESAPEMDAQLALVCECFSFLQLPQKNALV